MMFSALADAGHLPALLRERLLHGGEVHATTRHGQQFAQLVPESGTAGFGHATGILLWNLPCGALDAAFNDWLKEGP